MPDQWFVFRSGTKQGPLSSLELRRMAATGSLLPTDEIWREGMFARVPAASVTWLFPGSHPAVPPAMRADASPPRSPAAAPPTPPPRPAVPGPTRPRPVAAGPPGSRPGVSGTTARTEPSPTGFRAPEVPTRWLLVAAGVVSGCLAAVMFVGIVAVLWRQFGAGASQPGATAAASHADGPASGPAGDAADRVDPPASSASTSSPPAGRGTGSPAAAATDGRFPEEIANQRPWPAFPLERLHHRLAEDRDSGDTSAFFSPSGKHIVTVSGDGSMQRVRVWQAATGAEVAARGSDVDYFSLPAAFSPDEDRLACVDGEFLRVWNLRTNPATLVQSVALEGPKPKYGNAEDAWNLIQWPRATTILLGMRSQLTHEHIHRVLREAGGRFAPAGDIHRSPDSLQGGNTIWFGTLALTHDARFVATAERPLEGGGRLVLRIANADSGAEVATSTIQDVKETTAWFPSRDNAAPCENCIAFTPDDAFLLVAIQGDTERSYAVVDARTGRLVSRIRTDDVSLPGADWPGRYLPWCFSPDSRLLAGIGFRATKTSRGKKVERIAVVNELATGTRIAEIPLGDAFLWDDDRDTYSRRQRESMAFSADGTSLTVAVFGAQGWNNTTNRAEATWSAGNWRLADRGRAWLVSKVLPGGSTRLGPDGKAVIVDGDGLQVWDLPHLVHLRSTLDEADRLWAAGNHAGAFAKYCAIIPDSMAWFVHADLPRVWSRCIDVFAERGETAKGRSLALRAQEIGLRVAPETTQGKALHDGLLADQAAEAARLEEANAADEARRVANVRARNKGRRIVAARVTRAEFVDTIKATMSRGHIDGLVTYALFEDHAFEDVFGPPDSDVEWVNSQRLLGYRCRDGVVQLTATVVGPRVIVQGINLY